jgi:hypothetical protein
MPNNNKVDASKFELLSTNKVNSDMRHRDLKRRRVLVSVLEVRLLDCENGIVQN